MPSAPEPIEILLVEDSPSDALLTREALEFSKILNSLHHVQDGMEALAFLRRDAPYAVAPRPGLVLLDLNLPGKNGLEVLAEIKADPELRTIPVVVLTTSKGEEDIVKSYGLHANCYVVKPVDFGRFAEVVRSIQEFWFSIVRLPSAKP
ncbi:MAG TPA: response regulator [Opitutus sp.]|nr:response regulator [Opitutus sp.]